MSIIALSHISKRFAVKHKDPGFLGGIKSLFAPRHSTVEALCDINLEVAEGESVALIGPNGAGKSTTIKLLTGLMYPSAGEARVLGRVPWEQREALSYQIGVVFGHRSQLWYHLPAGDTFDLLADLYELDPTAYRRRRAWLVEMFGLEKLLTVPVRNLSLGERMRCELTASLLHQPRVLFLDEPTVGLDVIGKQIIRNLIRAINQEERTTILLTSHDTGDIEQVSRRVLVLNQGRIIYQDALENLSRRFLQRKEVRLRLGHTLKPVAAKGVEVVESGEFAARLLVDTRVVSIQSLVAELLGNNQVLDITINDPSLESTIAAIYTAQRSEEGVG